MIKKLSKQFLVFVLILFLASCAPSPIKLSEIHQMAQYERIVFGRVKVILGKEVINWEWKLFGPGKFDISILPDASSKAFSYRLSGGGSFYWHLPPGGYSIAGFHWERNGFSGGRIFADFTVPKEKTATYIGTLMILFGGGRYYFTIKDDFEEAVNAFNSKFATFKEPITKSLLRLEKRR